MYGLPWWLRVCNAGDPDLIPGIGRSPGEGNCNSLQYACLKIPWTEELGRLQTMGSKRIRHDQARIASIHDTGNEQSSEWICRQSKVSHFQNGDSYEFKTGQNQFMMTGIKMIVIFDRNGAERNLPRCYKCSSNIFIRCWLQICLHM